MWCEEVADVGRPSNTLPGSSCCTLKFSIWTRAGCALFLPMNAVEAAVGHGRIDGRVRIESGRESVVPVECFTEAVDRRDRKPWNKTLPVTELTTELAHGGGEETIAAPGLPCCSSVCKQSPGAVRIPKHRCRRSGASVATRAVTQECQRARQTASARIGNIGSNSEP